MAGPTTSSAARTPPGSVSRACRAAAARSPRGRVRRTAIPCPAGGSISPRNISWVRRRPRFTPMTARRSRTGRRYRSKPPRSAAAIRNAAENAARHYPSARLLRGDPPYRTRRANSSTAGPSSTARSMPSPGAAGPSASSGTAIAATTTPISISSASPCRSPCPRSRASMAASGAFAPTSATAPNWNWCCPRARKPSRTIS